MSPLALARIHPFSTPVVLRRAVLAPVLLSFAALVPATGAPISFEDRVRCEESIERVHHGQRIGASRTFEEAVSREVLERRVRRTLRQSAALERFWQVPITGEMLQAELARIARDTRLPGRLQELYDALGGSPFLAQECLARPVLVDRLSRSFFAFDERIHAATRTEAEMLRMAVAAGDLDPGAEHPQRTVLEIVRRGGGATPTGIGGEGRRPLHGEEYARERGRAPRKLRAPGPVVEGRHDHSFQVVLDEAEDRATIAVYSIPKIGWDGWWSGVEDHLDMTVEVPDAVAPLPEPAGVAGLSDWDAALGPPGGENDCQANAWDNGTLDSVPVPRAGHTAVWTGSRMIVWGGTVTPGRPGSAGLSSGARYDPLTDSWTPTSTAGAPSERSGHTAVWTGTEMIVWGGVSAGVPLATGGRYDPVADTWHPMTPAGAPAPRSGHTAVWTGTEMIVWGGHPDLATALGNGGRYDPAADTWSPVSISGAPQARTVHTAVWTGSRMVVWGGAAFAGPFASGGELNSGGRYDPSTDSWEPVSQAGGPDVRREHTAVWTGTEMIVHGGTRETGFTCWDDWGDPHEFRYAKALASGSRYDPVADSWQSLPPLSASAARGHHTAIWDGERMIVTGGEWTDTVEISSNCTWAFPVWLRQGTIAYDPVADAWSGLPAPGAPVHTDATAIWTGQQMIVWGGRDDLDVQNTGGRYDPAAAAWTPTSVGQGPTARSDHSAVWTGAEMIIWGGASEPGARYDPLVGSWTSTAVSGAPGTRGGHTSVWTGDEMIVWGGTYNGVDLSSGGRYDPIADTWLPTATSGAPTERTNHAAVWSGTEMIVWGGRVSSPCCQEVDSGARYNPLTDSWTPTSMVGAPAAREHHAAVWTGDEMIVWGGDSDTGPLDSGARYDPAADAWSPTSVTGAPSARYQHTAVWNGSRMIAWGGFGAGWPIPTLDTGGMYDPVTDQWETVPTAGAPAPRAEQTAVWFGSRMIVWGGRSEWGGGSPLLSSGGAFDPVTGDWVATPLEGAPLGRIRHTAVGTGTHMIVWGGLRDGVRLADGGAYSGALRLGDPCTVGLGACTAMGTVVCSSDGSVGICDAVPGQPTPEQCDGIDNDCDGIADSYATACGVGACAAVGACIAGIDSCLPGEPSAEVCDGLDNDCDGSLLPEEVDLDGDGFLVCAGDCDDGDPARFPGNPEICDSIDNDCDGIADSFPTSCGVGACAATGTCQSGVDDCEPGLPAAETCDGIDNDCDGIADSYATTCGVGACAAVGTCIAGIDSCLPGGPSAEVCDGLDNDCDGTVDAYQTFCGLGDCASTGQCLAGADTCVPGTPSAEECDGRDNDCDGILHPMEQDPDADGAFACAGDCAPFDGTTYPGAPEVNDGADNQCPGDAGFGLVDEVSGVLGFSEPQQPDRICWPAQGGAAGYELLRSDTSDFGAACSRFSTAVTCVDDPVVPVSGRVAHYLVRSLAPNLGSLGRDSAGVSRSAACGGEQICDDGLDDDLDGLVDCADADCFRRDGCNHALLSFTDTAGVDLPAGALDEFFSAVVPLASDYIHLELGGVTGVPGFEWCAQRADAYQQQYLAFGASGGLIYSGGWSVWYRASGAPWSTPMPTQFPNFYGDSCLGAFSWCAEVGLDNRGIALQPGQAQTCEAQDLAFGCLGAGHTLTIEIGTDRLTACGF